MPATGAVHLVTGVPFAATFGSGVNTFTVAGNYTSIFGTNSLLTVIGGAPNGGYREVTTASFAGGNTTITSVPYSTGTAYPGPTNFTSGSGTIILFSDVGTPPPPPATTFQFVAGGPVSTGALANASPAYHGDGVGFYDGSLNGSAASAGSIIPSGKTLNGNTIVACSWQGNGPPANGFVFAVHATVAQNNFTTLSVAAPANYTLASASADTFDTTTWPGYSVWIWAAQGSDEFAFIGSTLSVSIT